jgi:hypothetical protein
VTTNPQSKVEFRGDFSARRADPCMSNQNLELARL